IFVLQFTLSRTLFYVSLSLIKVCLTIAGNKIIATKPGLKAQLLQTKELLEITSCQELLEMA
ncbi:hypothetical protein GIB67_003749, partial [Kingdonia uniflora]